VTPERTQALSPGGARGLLGQPGLAYASFAGEKQHPAAALPNAGGELPGPRHLFVPPEHGRTAGAFLPRRRDRGGRDLYRRHPAGNEIKRLVLPDDGSLQQTQLGPWVEAEVFAQHLPPLLVGRQGIRLPAGSVERQHQQGPEALPVGRRPDLLGEFTDEQTVIAPLKQKLGSQLDRRPAQFLEPADFRLGKREEPKVQIRLALP
jgi:hypothetical protein